MAHVMVVMMSAAHRAIMMASHPHSPAAERAERTEGSKGINAGAAIVSRKWA